MTGPDEAVGLAADVISELQSQGQVPSQHDVGPTSVVPYKPETVRTTVRPAEAIRPKPDRSEGLHFRPHREIADVIERNDVEMIVGPWYLVGAVGIAYLDGVMAGAQPCTGEETPRIREGKAGAWQAAKGSTNRRAINRSCGVPDERAATFGEKFDLQWSVLRAGPGARKVKKQNTQ